MDFPANSGGMGGNGAEFLTALIAKSPRAA